MSSGTFQNLAPCREPRTISCPTTTQTHTISLPCSARIRLGSARLSSLRLRCGRCSRVMWLLREWRRCVQVSVLNAEYVALCRVHFHKCVSSTKRTRRRWREKRTSKSWSRFNRTCSDTKHTHSEQFDVCAHTRQEKQYFAGGTDDVATCSIIKYDF